MSPFPPSYSLVRGLSRPLLTREGTSGARTRLTGDAGRLEAENLIGLIGREGTVPGSRAVDELCWPLRLPVLDANAAVGWAKFDLNCLAAVVVVYWVATFEILSSEAEYILPCVSLTCLAFWQEWGTVVVALEAEEFEQNGPGLMVWVQLPG